MPLNSGANYVQGSPVIALRNGSWTQATVVNIQAGVYVITWTDTGLTTSEPASALRQADLCNCFVNRGTCAQYALSNSGITCNCAWSQNLGNICAPNANFNAQVLSTIILQCAPGQSVGAQTLKDNICISATAATALCTADDIAAAKMAGISAPATSTSPSIALGAGIGGGVGGLVLLCCLGAALCMCICRGAAQPGNQPECRPPAHGSSQLGPAAVHPQGGIPEGSYPTVGYAQASTFTGLGYPQDGGHFAGSGAYQASAAASAAQVAAGAPAPPGALGGVPAYDTSRWTAAAGGYGGGYGAHSAVPAATAAAAGGGGGGGGGGPGGGVDRGGRI